MYFKKMVENQRKAMEEYKWLKGQAIGHDPGEAACREWVEKYAATYRKEYNDLFAKMVEQVVKYTDDKVNKVLQESKCDLNPEIRLRLAKIFIEQFTNEWTIEKAMNPKNKHVDEI